MTDVTPALLNGADLLTSDVSEVHSPYDDALVGVVPACTTDDLDRAQQTLDGLLDGPE